MGYYNCQRMKISIKSNINNKDVKRGIKGKSCTTIVLTSFPLYKLKECNLKLYCFKCKYRLK